MASLFVIREKNTGAYCSSSRFNHFEADLQKAAMFNQRKNAEKAIRAMFRGSEKGEINRYGGWLWRLFKEDGSYQDFHHALLKEYIEFLKNHSGNHADLIRWLENDCQEQKCEMEIVEVRLTLV